MAISERDNNEDEAASLGSLQLQPDEYEWLEQQLAQLGEVTLAEGAEEDGEADWQDPSQGGALTAVLAACEEGDLDALQQALGRMGDTPLDAPGPDGDTALNLASLFGHAECVRALLDAGAAAAFRNPDDQSTALHDAAAGGYLEIMTMLLDAGCPVDAADGDGDTALHNAARGEHAGAVKLLLAAGASPQAENEVGHTPAGETDSQEVKQLLEAAAGGGGGEGGGAAPA